jgi:ubiquinone/menaquinone biosynthesis C-methylase UbiE
MDDRRQIGADVQPERQIIGDEGFVLYLDNVQALGWAQAYKRRTFALLAVEAGQRILDVGCGTGEDVRMLASLVGKTGQVVGVDASAARIEEARKRSEGSSLPVEYVVGDAHYLAFDDNTFDSCRADRTFQHLALPQLALAEMIRVTRTGGRLVVSDPDWETLIVDLPDQAVTRKILNFWCDSMRNGWMGRRLPRLFQQCGLTEITVITNTLMLTNYGLANHLFQFQRTTEDAHKAGIITQEEASNWLKDLEQASASGRFFCAVTGFGVGGRKP